jgi:hypothetical protein
MTGENEIGEREHIEILRAWGTPTSIWAADKLESLSERVLELPPEALRVLDEMSDEVGYSAATIASYCGLTEQRVRRWQQAFQMLGLAEFGTLHDLDGEGLRGRGYWLNATGYKLQGAMRRAAITQSPIGGSNG